MIRAIILFVILLTACGDGSPRFLRSVDGDTIVLTDGRHARIKGIDTAETKCRCPAECDLAYRATLFTRIAFDKPYRIVPDGHLDKYGRTLVTVYIEGTDIADLLVEAGLGRRYNGRTARQSWC
jgi:endonuclease YncB( thermonuclease family)